MHWNALAVPAMACFVIAIAVGWLVVASHPEGRENRRLGLLLFIEGIVIFSLHGGQYLLDDYDAAWWLIGLGTIAVAIKPAAYLHFLATLDTPLVRPLRGPGGKLALVALTLVGAATWFVIPGAFVADLRLVDGSWEPIPGFLLRPMALVLSLVYLAAICFSVSAFRHARSPIQRKRMKAYIVAFVTRDVLFIVWSTAFLAVSLESAASRYVFLSITVMPLVYIPLVGYGILHCHLFGIELHLKQGVRNLILAAPFPVVFFLVTEGLEQAVPFDSAWLGIAAAGAVTLALQPIKRLAQSVADDLFPGVGATDEYYERRAREVYQASVEAVWSDRVLRMSEERVLTRMREQLGLSERAATEIEHEVRGHRGETARA